MPDSETGGYSDYLTEPALQESPVSAVPAAPGRRLVLLVFIIALLVALAALASSASRWKKEVIVRDFIVDGVSIIPERELLSRMADYKGANLQELDADELKQRIKRLPYLRDAVISKELNGIVRVKVVEREPVALAIIGRSTMVIDREGFLLPWRKEVAIRFPDLFSIARVSRLTIADNGLQQLDRRDVALILQFLDALSKSDYARLLVKEFHLAANNLSWCIAVQAPTRFIIGNDGNFKEKLKKFEIFWQKVVSKKGFGFYDTVDLRFKERIFTTQSSPPEAQVGSNPVIIRQE
ncbi:MAG: FtsQ-type POTRA domain-containing protein [Chlorobium sp.]|nr:MAG: FtsQ-type POTRA domain-containing protein [Chlorobium sp.]